MKKGWLVVNGFLHSRKFSELYGFLSESARRLNTELKTVTTDSLLADATSDFTQFEKPDFVLFWDKDVCLAKRLEKAGFRLFNSAEAVEACDSKTLTVMKLCGKVPMPKTFFSPKTFENVGYTNLDFVKTAAEQLGFPFVVKEAFGSFGEQVYLVRTMEEAESVVRRLAGKDFLMQQFVSESCGRDVRVNVVGGKAVNAVFRRSVNGDFRSNVTLGGAIEQHSLTQEEKSLAEKASQLLGLDFDGVDLLLGADGPILCEVNSNLHFKSTFDCTGVDLSENILQHILKKTG